MDFNHFLKDHQNRVNTVLEKTLPADQHNELHRAMRYAVLNGGKRLRPILVYATGELLNGFASALDIPACAIELIHCYSLIHDDLPAMDDATLRRGNLTCHKKFNEATAILAGDTLQTLSFNILTNSHDFYSSSQQIKMVAILSQACIDMAEGQALDIINQSQISIEELNNINNLKTGSLINASVLLGAVAANCENQKILTALSNYAHYMGLAFQIRDDVLDIESSAETLGKISGADQKLNKTTYPALIGVTNSKKKIQQLYEKAIAQLESINLNNSLLSDLATYSVMRKK